MPAEKVTINDEIDRCSVYMETTEPYKKKRRDKSDLGPDFIAPDGGWGWIVCVAAGVCNCAVLPLVQFYGLIYRQRMQDAGFDAKQTTSIITTVLAVSSVVGTLSGGIYRRFSLRQVALAGSLLVFIGIFASAFSHTFGEYILWMACVYGIGQGFCLTAGALAVNVYFKERRRRATGFTWTITGLGPIIFPFVANWLMYEYGSKITILTFSAIGLNTFACALTFQPVLWHAKKPSKDLTLTQLNSETIEMQEYLCQYCQYRKIEEQNSKKLQNGRKGSGPLDARIYITNASDSEVTNLAQTNGGISFIPTQLESIEEHTNESESAEAEPLHITKLFNNNEREYQQLSYPKIEFGEQKCTCSGERTLHKSPLNTANGKTQSESNGTTVVEHKNNLTILQKLIKFFDFNLLRDFTFTNIVVGMTIMLFGDINFSVLVPFILNNYGYNDSQISLAMSLLAGMDITVRFVAPLALEKVKLSNQFLFAFGIAAQIVGRFVVTTTSSFQGVVAMFVIIGFGKGFRTVFAPLILPTIVPINRLPAAMGLQLMFKFFSMIIGGPILGLITDNWSYTVTIHVMNLLALGSMLVWILEWAYRKMTSKKIVANNETAAN